MECRSHHPWRPDTVIVSWEPCGCPPAMRARGGHLVVQCLGTGCPERWTLPLCKPALLVEPKSKDRYHR